MITLINEKKLKSGDVRWDYDITKEFKDFTKLHFNVKRFTEKLGNRLILECIYNAQLRDLKKGFQRGLELNGIA